jgi:hypothetical protein
MIITKPNMEDVPVFYRSYVDTAEESNMLDALKLSRDNTLDIFGNVPAEKLDFKYAEGKWSIKEVLQHLVDAERVMAYRALRFSRNDPAPLPGFEENEYVPNSNAVNRSMENLLTEYELLRNSDIELFSGMNESMLDFLGTANEQRMNARMSGWIIAGHNQHHNRVIREKYL